MVFAHAIDGTDGRVAAARIVSRRMRERREYRDRDRDSGAAKSRWHKLSRGEPRIDGGNVVVPYRGNYGTATMGKTKYSLCGSPDVPRDQRGLGLTP